MNYKFVYIYFRLPDWKFTNVVIEKSLNKIYIPYRFPTFRELVNQSLKESEQKWFLVTDYAIRFGW